MCILHYRACFVLSRASVTIRALAERNHTIHIITTAPARLFSELLQSYPTLIHIRSLASPNEVADPGIVQSDAVSVDVEASFDALRGFLGGVEERVEREVRWLGGVGVDCVLLDASFLPALAAKILDIPCILITNFTFDAIYDWISRSGNLLDEQACASVREMYDSVGFLLRLPGTIPIPSFDNPSDCRRLSTTDEDVCDSPSVTAGDLLWDNDPVTPATVAKASHHIPSSLSSSDLTDPNHPTTKTPQASHRRTPSMKQGDTTASWSPKPRPRLDRQQVVLDLPLVVRMQRRSRSEVRNQLGIPLDAKILLITFGGFAVGGTAESSKSKRGGIAATHIAETSSMSISDGSLAFRNVTSLPQQSSTATSGGVDGWRAEGLLPDGWVGVFAVPTGAADVINHLGQQRFLAAPPGSYVPDLIGAADCVAGKCGYSTCAEVVAHGVPFVYVPRPQFAEEAGLLSNLMRPFGCCVEMPQEKFYAGEWAGYVLSAHKLRLKGPRATIPLDGDTVAVRAIESVVDGKGLGHLKHLGLKAY
ncbi:hypothetical protein HDU67_005707 [Dinochytrium kinnereticum]|nr:hypothetical protein HDU67_005707 [Dinochytrium kinnereticum]